MFDIVCNCVMFALLVSGGSASANRRLIVSYSGVKHSLWNSGLQEGSLIMELRDDSEGDSLFTKLLQFCICKKKNKKSL